MILLGPVDRLRSNLGRMALFCSVVENGSFSAAARELSLSRSAVSESIAALERAVDSRLLERTTRQVRMTASGRLFHEHCERMMRTGREALDSLDDQHQTPRGTLRVTAPGPLASLLIAPVVAGLRRAHDIRVELSLGAAHVDLMQDNFDVAVRVGNRPRDSSLVVRVLGNVPEVLVAGAVLARRIREPSDLASQPWVAHTAQPEIIRLTSRGKNVAVQLDPAVRVNRVETVLDLVSRGVGFGYSPEPFSPPRSRLRRVLPGWRMGEVSVYMLLPSRKNLPARTRVFIDALAARWAEVTAAAQGR